MEASSISTTLRVCSRQSSLSLASKAECERQNGPGESKAILHHSSDDLQRR